jgi:hypothetical protein
MVEIRGGIEIVSSENYAGEIIARFCEKLEVWSGNLVASPPAIHGH